MWRWFLVAIVVWINGCASEDVQNERPDARAPQHEDQHGNYG